MSDSAWRTLFLNSSNLLETCYSEIFEVADYDSDDGFQRFKMSDSIWRITE